MVNRIPTRFKLTGPDGLTPEALQDALFEAARRLLREDAGALAAVCRWFADHGLPCRTDLRSRSHPHPTNMEGLIP